MLKRKILFLPLVLLSSCSYGNKSKSVKYENYFFLWPTGVTYTSFLDTYKSSFYCYFDMTYKYNLVYKSGTTISYTGTYFYNNETFVLNYNDEVVRTLTKANYYEFNEKLVYQEQEYTLIWHAQYIFD